MEFQKKLENLINRFSMEGISNTPDFVLAAFIANCLQAYALAVKERDTFFNFKPFGD